MNQLEHTESEFERRLRAELKAIVTERGAVEPMRPADDKPVWRRRGPRFGLAASAIGAVAAVVLIVNASGDSTPPAFAVEAQPEGMVSVEIRSPEDATGLETALDEAGISASVTYLAAGTTCREPRFRPMPWPEGARAIVVGPPEGAPRELSNATVVGGPEGARTVIQEPTRGGGAVTFWISSAAVGPGQTLVITASVSAGGIFGAGTPPRVELAEGTVSPCEVVPVQP